MEVWTLTAVCVVGVIAFVRNTALVRRVLPGRGAAAEPGRFEQFWSQRNGRLLAVAWIVLFALTVGDAGMVWGWPPVVSAAFVAQQVGAVALIPLTAGLYVYKRALPHVAHDDADERERAIQGDVYRRAHAIAIGALAIASGLLVVNPTIGSGLALRAESRGVELIDVLLPAFLLLFMLPSVAYAWMNPHRDDESPDAPRRSRFSGWLVRPAAR